MEPVRNAARRHESDETDALEGLPVQVLAQSGLDPAAYRAAPLRRRVPACLRTLRTDAERAACARLNRDVVLRDAALSSLLIGVSSFFRDPDVFGALRSIVIPDLARRTGTLRVLSLACSFGAELHSVAMLLAEARILHRAELVGVDCRADAVRAARAAVFDEPSLAGVPPELRARYFEPAGYGWRVQAALRSQTTWQVADATRAVPEGPWDLVLCRNFLMYLRGAVAEDVCQRATATLAPRGVLVLGKAERPPRSLPLTALARCVYRVDGR